MAKQMILMTCFTILVSGTIFLCTTLFTDSQFTPKWYWLYGCTFIFGIITCVFQTFNKKKISIGQIDIALFIFCVYILIRYLLTENISKERFIFLFAVLLLYVIFRQKKIINNVVPLFGLLGILCFLQAGYGSVQYVKSLLLDTEFRITGSFDNPAGFAACLSVCIPFCFYFTKNENKTIRYLAYSLFVFITLNIILSESRAGMISTFCTSVLYLFMQHDSLLVKVNIWIKAILTFSLFVLLLGCLYFIKQDSAQGRILIWTCSTQMIKDKPLFGHGPDAFNAKYMLYQGNYFKTHPGNKFEILADNVNHPFNESVLLFIEYGLISFIFLSIIILNIIRVYLKNKTHKTTIAIICLFNICIFSVFSYPLKYPFIWVLICLSSAILSSEEGKKRKITHRQSVIIYLTTCILSIFFFIYTCLQLRYEYQWSKIARLSLSGLTEQMIPVYEKLYPSMKDRPLFLYNYAAELNVIEEYGKSLEVTKECEKLFNDYDLQILIADNYYNLKEYSNAESCFLSALSMCPNRFIPLYKLMNIYDVTNRQEEALAIGNIILNKPVKIPSTTIYNIKKEIENRLNNAVIP